MLHTKFRGNRPAGSGEEDFEGFIPYMGVGGHLGHVTISYRFLTDVDTNVSQLTSEGAF